MRRSLPAEYAWLELRWSIWYPRADSPVLAEPLAGAGADLAGGMAEACLRLAYRSSDCPAGSARKPRRSCYQAGSIAAAYSRAARPRAGSVMPLGGRKW